jgi:hypothetical protein
MRNRFLVAMLVVLASFPAFAQEPPRDAADALITKFEEAVKADNYAAMKDLVVKAGPTVVLDAYWRAEYQLVSAISNKSEEDKTARLGVLEKFVNLVSQEFKDRSLADRLAWAKVLAPEQATKRLEMDELFRDGSTALARAEKAGEKPLYQEASAKYAKATALAAENKDVYWTIDGNVWLGFVAKKIDDKFQAAYYYKRADDIVREQRAHVQAAKYGLGNELKTLARTGLRDDLIDIALPLEESRKKYTEQMEKLAAEAVNPGAGGADSRAAAPGSPKGAAMPGTLPPAANKHVMRIEWVEAEKSKYQVSNGRPILTPNIQANGHWFFWVRTELSGAAGKQTIIPGDHSFKVDKGKIMFDPDGAGKAAEERLKIPLGKTEPLAFKQRTFPDGSKVDVHFLALEVPNAFVLNGFNLELKAGGPNDPVDVRWQGASSVKTKFDGWDITVYDDSGDGRFDTFGDDSITIGKGKPQKAIPLSRYIQLGDLLFDFKLDPNGQNMRFKPYDGPIALLQLDWVGAAVPTFLILEGLNENAQFFLNLVECKDKPIWVPPGEYKFRNGYFAFGDGEKRETIRITNSGKATSFKVAEGQLNKVPMGGAKAPGFTCTWKTEQMKEKGKTIIALKGKTIKIYGCGGEEYEYFTTGVFRPTVKMRSGKDGPVFYDKQMKAPAREDLGEGKPWSDVIFFPKDIEVEKAASGDVFVTLEGEYPKLGKITSTPAQVE